MTCRKGCCPDYRTHIRGVNIGGFPDQITYRDRKLDLDRDAYKRLRRDGLQPKSIDGSYVLERSANDPLEVAMGRPLDADTKAILADMP